MWNSLPGKAQGFHQILKSIEKKTYEVANGCQPKNRGGPHKSSILIGFSMGLPSILGVLPLFLETPKCKINTEDSTLADLRLPV